LLIACVACLFAMQPEKMVTIPFWVEVEADGEIEQITPWVNDNGTGYVFLPAYADAAKATLRLKTTDEVYIQDVRLTDQMNCGDFQLEVPYELGFSAWGKMQQRQIMFVQSAKVPTMFIDTESGSMEYIHAKKGNEEAGEMRLYLADGSLSYVGKINDINGRGNNTWEEFEKKPYSMNLVEEADLLGMGAAQKWILLANADDPSHMRNKMVFDFADEIGLAFSPDAEWVDLYLNGEYVGLYLLSERNEVATERVNIEKKNGFLVSIEIMKRLEQQGYLYVVTKENQAVRIHYPENIDKRKPDILVTLQSVENAIMNENGIDQRTGKSWSELIDVDSWVRKYLIEEVFVNGDGCAISQFFYGLGEKLYAGPVWDYDHAIGTYADWRLMRANYLLAERREKAEGHEAPWFYSLNQKREFKEMVMQCYQNVILPKMNGMISGKIDEYVMLLKKAGLTDGIRWREKANCLEKEVEYIKEFLGRRIDFLNRLWEKKQQYNVIKIDQRRGETYGCLACFHGEKIEAFPDLPDNAYQTFLGWYYEGTDEPFDPDRPIYEDTAVYAKWEDTPYKRISQVKKLLPAGVIAIMFLAILAADVRRMRKGG